MKLNYNIKYILGILDYNSSFIFRPSCVAIFRLIFEQVECKFIMLSIT
jgi:hypothetical protein